MTGAISTIVYILGYLVCLRYVSRAVAYDFISTGGTPEGGDWVMGIMLGSIAAIAWPIALPIAYAASKPAIFESLMGAPERVERARKEQELAEREREVARLERELGIGKTA